MKKQVIALAAAGLSMNIEMVPHESKIGGISAILANSLSLLGMDLTFIGACGEDARIIGEVIESDERVRLL